ncbi:hypothetical protein AB4254_09115 [Vibrio breoganii]
MKNKSSKLSYSQNLSPRGIPMPLIIGGLKEQIKAGKPIPEVKVIELNGKFEIIDGLQRHLACDALGLDTPYTVMSCLLHDAMRITIKANRKLDMLDRAHIIYGYLQAGIDTETLSAQLTLSIKQVEEYKKLYELSQLTENLEVLIRLKILPATNLMRLVNQNCPQKALEELKASTPLDKLSHLTTPQPEHSLDKEEQAILISIHKKDVLAAKAKIKKHRHQIEDQELKPHQIDKVKSAITLIGQMITTAKNDSNKDDITLSLSLEQALHIELLGKQIQALNIRKHILNSGHGTLLEKSDLASDIGEVFSSSTQDVITAPTSEPSDLISAGFTEEEIEQSEADSYNDKTPYEKVPQTAPQVFTEVTDDQLLTDYIPDYD